MKFSTAEDEEEEQNDDNDAKCEDILRRLHECISKLPHANYYTVVRLFKHLRRFVFFSTSVPVITFDYRERIKS